MSASFIACQNSAENDRTVCVCVCQPSLTQHQTTSDYQSYSLYLFHVHGGLLGLVVTVALSRLTNERSNLTLVGKLKKKGGETTANDWNTRGRRWGLLMFDPEKSGWGLFWTAKKRRVKGAVSFNYSVTHTHTCTMEIRIWTRSYCSWNMNIPAHTHSREMMRTKWFDKKRERPAPKSGSLARRIDDCRPTGAI